MSTDDPIETRTRAQMENLTSGTDVTNIASIAPHALIFRIKLPGTDKFLMEAGSHPPRPVAWIRTFPTADAARDLAREIQWEMNHLKGEPSQAWSTVVRLSNCPNASLLPRYKNLHMEVRPYDKRRPNQYLEPETDNVPPPVPAPGPGKVPPGDRPGDSSAGPKPRKPRTPRAAAAGGTAKVQPKRTARKQKGPGKASSKTKG